MIYIGIDPGVSGGIAVLGSAGQVFDTHKMPETPADLAECFRSILTLRGIDRPGVSACLERVNAGVFGQQKTGRMGVTSAFSFGRVVGRLEQVLACAEVPYTFISPITWQNALGCRTHGDKNISKARAQQLFPSLHKITHAIADALLLAEFCRRAHGQEAATRYGGIEDGKKENDAKGRQTGQAHTQECGTTQGGSRPAARSAQRHAPRDGAGSDRPARQPV